MNQPLIRGVIEGKNSVLFETSNSAVLYEKLVNTIYNDEQGKLASLQQRIESVDYKPYFETESLQKRKSDHVGILLFEVTEQCNLRCSYCIYSGNYINERTATPKMMSFDTAKKAMDELVPLSKDNVLIGFYGGEPSLNMNLVRQIIAYSRSSFPSREFTFSMTTNFFQGDKYVPEIVDNGMYINLSFDGPKEVHDRFRRTINGNPTYEKILSNLRKVEGYFPGYVHSHFFVLTTCHDLNDLEKIVKFFDETEFFVTNLNRTETKGKIGKDSFPPCDNYHLIKMYQDRILGGEDPRTLRRLFDRELKTIASRDKRITPEKLMLNGSCYPGKRRIFIDVNGVYHPCERFGSRLPIGSIEKGMQQGQVDSYIEQFAEMRNTLCRECWAQRLCAPCLQYAKDPEGEISLKGLAQTCNGKKKQLLIGLDTYTTLLKLNRQRAEDYIKGINPLFERG